jgi:hypothetical protein
MQALLKLVGFLAALLGGVYALGLMVPDQHSVSRTGYYHQPIAVVWQAINAMQDYPAWRHSANKVEAIKDQSGRVVWRLTAADGKYTDIQNLPDPQNRKMTSRILATTMSPVTGEWVFSLREESGMTALTVTENGNMQSVFLRPFYAYIVGYDTGILDFLGDLGNKFGEQPLIQ